jgi:mitochondrial fission protein ELM1
MRKEVEAAIVQFEGVSHRITQVVATMSLEARGRLIELRRDHAAAMLRLNDAVGQALRGASHPDIDAITEQFHQQFGDMRRAISLHQGKWPAVLIGENNRAYVESAKIADAAKMKAITWVRRVLVPIL